jgi:ABC-type nitrate/sulfonate/bicarbonate transport system permease component
VGSNIVNDQDSNIQETKRRLIRTDQVMPPLLLLVLLLVCWQGVTVVWQIEPWLLPSPLQIVRAALDAKDLLGPHIWQTMVETLVGFMLATTVGFGLALTIDFSTTLRRAIYPILVISQTVPIIAIAPLLVIWFGYGILPKVLVVSLVCFFPIVVSMADGLQSADPDLIALLQAMGASRRQVFWKVRLPGALPAVFSGIKIAITYSVIGAIIGEWVGASRGLGVFMLRSTNAFRTDWLFAAIAITALLSVILFLIVSGLERALLPWYHTPQREEQWEEL